MDGRLTRPALSVLVTLAVLFGAAAGVSAQPSVGGVVSVALTEEPDTLDPQKTATNVAGIILRYAGDTLITKDLDGEYVPGLASSWEVSPDGLRWTFHLKQGVRFHNGNRLTAEAVKASFERALDPGTRSPIAGSLFGPIQEIEVLDEYTLRLRLREPFSPFLDNLTDPRAAVVDATAAAAAGDTFGRAPVLTGPWKVNAWRSGDRITLARNPDYAWGPAHGHAGAPYLQSLVFRIIPEAATQVAALESGEVDVLNVVPPTDVERLDASGRFQVVSFLRKGVGLFMEFNVQRPPFDDRRVRLAMNHAIDKEPVLQIALRGLGETAYGPLPPSIWGYWEGIREYAPDYDPDRAKALLDEAGWLLGGDGLRRKDGQPLSFELFTAPIDTWTRSAQVVQSQLRELGIQVEIRTYEFGTLLERLQAGDHQADFMGYTYTSPDIFYLWFHSSNIGTGLAHSHFDDARMDSLIEESRRETDTEATAAIYRELQKYVVDESLWVPLWTNYQYIALQEWVVDAKVHPDGYLFLLDAYLEE